MPNGSLCVVLIILLMEFVPAANFQVYKLIIVEVEVAASLQRMKKDMTVSIAGN